MDLEKLDSKVKNLWLIRNLICVLFILVTMIILVVAIEEYRLILSLGLGIPALLLSVLLIIWPFWCFKCYAYGYDEKRIFIQFGVIFKHRIIIPIRQIQDLHIYNGPLMSAFKISGVIISTAGSNFMIAGLKQEVATEMVSKLEEQLNTILENESHEEI